MRKSRAPARGTRLVASGYAVLRLLLVTTAPRSLCWNARYALLAIITSRASTSAVAGYRSGNSRAIHSTYRKHAGVISFVAQARCPATRPDFAIASATALASAAWNSGVSSIFTVGTVGFAVARRGVVIGSPFVTRGTFAPYVTIVPDL